MDPGAGDAGEGDREREDDAAERGADVLELVLLGPARLAAGEVLVDLGDVAGGEATADVGAEAVDGEAALGIGRAP